LEATVVEHPASIENLQKLKQRYPGMDLEMVHVFAETMMVFHRVPIMMEGYFNRLGLSKGRFMVMIQLHSIEDPAGISISEILEAYQVSSATMTGIIDTLEGEGLIERLRSPGDRRRVHVRITEAGRSFMDSFLPRHQEYIRRFTSRLTVDERRTLLSLLEKLSQGISEAVAEDPPEATEDPSWPASTPA
jgi:DNA-binding MarR family transcriptional regulator